MLCSEIRKKTVYRKISAKEKHKTDNIYDIILFIYKIRQIAFIINVFNENTRIQKKKINLLSTALSDITYTDSPHSPSGAIGVYFATI